MQYVINEQNYSLTSSATPKKISAWLRLHGLKSLNDLFGKTEEDKDRTVREMAKMSLSLVGDERAVHELLQVCLNEPVTPEVAANADIHTIAQIDLDFFFVLIVKLFAPGKLSGN